jgi:hypothetical protein
VSVKGQKQRKNIFFWGEIGYRLLYTSYKLPRFYHFGVEGHIVKLLTFNDFHNRALQKELLTNLTESMIQDIGGFKKESSYQISGRYSQK